MNATEFFIIVSLCALCQICVSSIFGEKDKNFNAQLNNKYDFIVFKSLKSNYIKIFNKWI